MDLEDVLDIEKISSSLSVKNIYAFSVINYIDFLEKSFINHFICKVILDSNIGYTNNNSGTKSNNHLDLIYTCF